MNAQPRDDLLHFHRFVTDKVANGEDALTPEEALDEWRAMHPAPDTREADVAAIQEAIDDIENGDNGVPFAEFDRAFRARRQLPPAS